MQDSKIIEEVRKFHSPLRASIMRAHTRIESIWNYIISPFARLFDPNTTRFSNSGFGIDLGRQMVPGFDKYLESLLYQNRCDFCGDPCPKDAAHRLLGSNGQGVDGRPICDRCLDEEE